MLFLLLRQLIILKASIENEKLIQAQIEENLKNFEHTLENVFRKITRTISIQIRSRLRPESFT